MSDVGVAAGNSSGPASFDTVTNEDGLARQVITLSTRGGTNVELLAQTAALEPAAGSSFEILIGGMAIILVAGPCNGGYVTNGAYEVRQGNIPSAEPFYVDPVNPPGSTDLDVPGEFGTTVALDPGGSYTIPALATGESLYGNAATTGHQVTVVRW